MRFKDKQETYIQVSSKARIKGTWSLMPPANGNILFDDKDRDLLVAFLKKNIKTKSKQDVKRYTDQQAVRAYEHYSEMLTRTLIEFDLLIEDENLTIIELREIEIRVHGKIKYLSDSLRGNKRSNKNPNITKFVPFFRYKDKNGIAFVFNEWAESAISDSYVNTIESLKQTERIIALRIEKMSLHKTPHNDLKDKPDYLAIAIACSFLNFNIENKEENSDVDKIKRFFHINSWQKLYRAKIKYIQAGRSVNKLQYTHVKRKNELIDNISEYLAVDPTALENFKLEITK
jgi:hypothetical protein